MYKNAVSLLNFYRPEKEHLTWKIDGFNGLATLLERLDESGKVSFTETAKHNNKSCSENNYEKVTTDRSYNWNHSDLQRL